ncbi:MAG: hypothetical protein U0232_14760 [Thermomicrobiales bacterium]
MTTNTSIRPSSLPPTPPAESEQGLVPHFAALLPHLSALSPWAQAQFFVSPRRRRSAMRHRSPSSGAAMHKAMRG